VDDGWEKQQEAVLWLYDLKQLVNPELVCYCQKEILMADVASMKNW
jgi:hypothetical protein